jgi:hypothetical protein
MKLSNKILLGFFAFIFMYLTAAFIEVRVSGTPNTIYDHNSIAETVDLSGITCLIVNDLNGLDKNLNVISSDRSRLEVRSLSGDLLKKLNYKISGDTLTLSEVQPEYAKNFRVFVFVSKSSLKKISVKSSSVHIEGLEQEFLHISQNAGRIWMSNANISKMQLDLSNRSYMEIYGTTLDTLSAQIEESQAYISSPVGVAQGSMKNNSILHLKGLREIQFKKDEGSRLNLY